MDVLAYDEPAFEEWRARDYALLESMLPAYQEVLDTLPASAADTDDAVQRRLYAEARRTLTIYVQRIRHALAIYGGVIAVRSRDRASAESALEAARAISAEVIEAVALGERDYRYPLALLAEPKPESKTAYPFGYLAETRAGFFWTRRDEQLARLIGDAFAADDEAWSTVPSLSFSAEGDAISLTEPANPLANSVLSGFIPRLVFGVLPPADGRYTVIMGQDANGNARPDAGSELVLDGEGLDPWRAEFAEYVVVARDTAGAEVGRLSIYQGSAQGTPTAADGQITALGPVQLGGEIASQQVIDMVRAIAGIDEEGISTLLKTVFEIDATAPLPARLPIVFNIETTVIESAP